MSELKSLNYETMYKEIIQSEKDFLLVYIKAKYYADDFVTEYDEQLQKIVQVNMNFDWDKEIIDNLEKFYDDYMILIKFEENDIQYIHDKCKELSEYIKKFLKTHTNNHYKELLNKIISVNNEFPIWIGRYEQALKNDNEKTLDKKDKNMV